jgi:replicative DNA helicase
MVATRSMLSVSRKPDPNSDLAVQVGRPIRTGFDALDYWTCNGIRQGELLLLGGAPGAGKTTLCLQMARNIAVSGQANVLYACYEHPPEYVLDRLLVQETIDPAVAGRVTGVSLDEFQALLAEAVRRNPNASPYELVRRHPVVGAAAAELDRYANRFHLVANAARKNDLGTLQALVGEYRAKSREPLVLFVDYLQKLESSTSEVRSEDERVTEVVQALKQLALQFNVAVVAIAAADKAGIAAPRLRLSHLRGSSALLYEADIAVIMNDKWQIIDRDHIVFNTHKAQQFRDWVVCTIEKNRSGRNLVEVEFQKRFEYCCFNPVGGKVSERLYEERIQGSA